MHYVTSHLSHLLYAALGGLITSVAEYVFSYNLFDLLKDKLTSLFSKSAPKPSVKS